MNANDILLGSNDGSLDRSYRCTPNFVDFDPRTGTIHFVTRCTANAWNQKVRFEDWDEIIANDSEAKWEDHKHDDIRVDCDCPANLYHGYRFIQTELNIAIKPESRFPIKNNEDLEGVVCKHLIAVLRRYFK